jgi:hypothetical protein
LRIRLSVFVLVAGVATYFLLAAPAFADHPDNFGIRPCTSQDVLDGRTVLLPDGQRWHCEGDATYGGYWWVPGIFPWPEGPDAIAYKKQKWTAPDGVIYRVTPRIEWLKSVLYTGSDAFTRKPATSAYFRPAGWAGVFSRLWVWDSATSTWSICRESAWVHNTAKSDRLVPTFNWGTAPCGARWYMTHGFVDYWNGSKWIYSPQLSTFGGTSLGSNAANGTVWDAPPGDNSRPTKPPKYGPMINRPPKEKKAAPPLHFGTLLASPCIDGNGAALQAGP